MTGSATAAAQQHRDDKKDYIVAAAIILLYCLAYASLRLLVSSTMELDEAEQFLAARFFSLGYPDQPPLFTWILAAAASLWGMNIVTIVAVKYSLLFCFYFSFYALARTFWDARKSLVVTGSLLLFPTYSYEFNRHLSHTILLAAMASTTCLIYVRLLARKTTGYYLLFGLSAGLGILSKYNFLFLLAALLLAGLSSKEGRKAVFDGRMILSVLIGIAIVLPHLLWLIGAKFPSVHEAFGKASTGALKDGSPLRVISVVLSSFIEALAFPAVFLLFFRRRIRNDGTVADPALTVLRWVPLYGLILPLIVILVFQMGHFSGKWLAPVFFSIPLALFSSFSASGKPLRVFGYLAVAAAVMVFLARAVIGFSPDVIGKVERIHTPVHDVAEQLTGELARKGIDTKDAAFVTDNGYLAANLKADMHEAEFILSDDWPRRAAAFHGPVIAVWDATEEGVLMPKKLRDSFPSAAAAETVSAPYLHSKRSPPYLLAVAIIPKN